MTAIDPRGRTDSAFVTVNVVRDQPPVFESTKYSTTVIENQSIGTSILTIVAVDSDLKVGNTSMKILSFNFIT